MDVWFFDVEGRGASSGKGAYFISRSNGCDTLTFFDNGQPFVTKVDHDAAIKAKDEEIERIQNEIERLRHIRSDLIKAVQDARDECKIIRFQADDWVSGPSAGQVVDEIARRLSK